MDRQIVYPGQIPLETDVLGVNKDAYVGLAKLAGAVLGSGPLVNGLACSPTSPAGMSVIVGAGEIYALEATDQTAYSSLGTDSHGILKQGISPDPVQLTFLAPLSSGYSINYLIEAAFDEEDINPVTLPYYNSENPAQTYSGPGGSGTAQNTVRQDGVAIQVKDGAPAPTGTQTTPAVDSGYIGLYVVTVAYGQTQIVAGNIAQVSGAPFIAETLGQKISQATADGRYLTQAAAASQYIPQAQFSTYLLAPEIDYANSSASGWTINLANGLVQDLTMTGSGTITLPASVAGQSYMLRIHYSGAYAITWAGGSTLRWQGGSAPTQTSANGNVDIFVFSCDGTNTFGASLLNF